MAEALLIPQFEQDLSDYALKSYVDSAVANKDVGVTTFNGRKGAVSPQSGDYTYSMVGAASSGHGHSGIYADYSHTHNYAAASHTHSYAASNHTHDYAASNHTHTVTGTSHTHTGYASSTHSHSEYASSSHTHSGYASSTHTHSYASSSHTHSGYASSSHTHSASDISGLSGGGLTTVDTRIVSITVKADSMWANYKATISSGGDAITSHAAPHIVFIWNSYTYDRYSEISGQRQPVVLKPGSSTTTQLWSSSADGYTVCSLTISMSSTGRITFSTDTSLTSAPNTSPYYASAYVTILG